MNKNKHYSLLIILVLCAAGVFSQSTSNEQVYTKIKNCFVNNDFVKLENFFPNDRKIYLFIPPVITRNGYFTSQQLHFILKDMQKDITTLNFTYEDKDRASGNNTSKKATWKFSKNGEISIVNIYIYVESISNEWKIVQIKIS